MNISFNKCNLIVSAQVRSVSTAAWTLGRQLHARTIHDRVEVLNCADGPRSENIQTNRSSTPEEIAVRSNTGTGLNAKPSKFAHVRPPGVKRYEPASQYQRLISVVHLRVGKRSPPPPPSLSALACRKDTLSITTRPNTGPLKDERVDPLPHREPRANFLLYWLWGS